MDALVLRLDAPLMSFGGVIVDHHNVTERFPGLSLFAGLFANALGWTHGEGDKIGSLVGAFHGLERRYLRHLRRDAALGPR